MQTLRSYGGGKREQLLGIMGERAFRMTDIAARWNIVQHFYPYHEEDNLRWESRLPEMLEAVDTLKTECSPARTFQSTTMPWSGQ